MCSRQCDIVLHQADMVQVSWARCRDFNVAIAMHADAHAAATCRIQIMGVGHGDSFLLCKSTQRLSTQERGTMTNDSHPDIIIQMTGIHRTIPS